MGVGTVSSMTAIASTGVIMDEGIDTSATTVKSRRVATEGGVGTENTLTTASASVDTEWGVCTVSSISTKASAPVATEMGVGIVSSVTIIASASEGVGNHTNDLMSSCAATEGDVGNSDRPDVPSSRHR
ncbi:hypothetical protein ACHAXA_010355 [Cyclostephanos tholiformis]|uniref:Uncharacterized protein n=1 Tax=Cyclostephanos tholiformis TaxID=382380 RepID=A0ABD3RSW4_9STRA